MTKVQPVACKYISTRWDGVRYYLVRMSDGNILEVWQNLAENPYNVNHLPIDPTIKMAT